MTTFAKTKGRTALVSVILAAVLIFSGVFTLTVHAGNITDLSYYGGQYDLTQVATDPCVNLDSVYAKTAENGILVRLHGSADTNLTIFIGKYSDGRWQHFTYYAIHKDEMSNYGYHNYLVPYNPSGSLSVSVMSVNKTGKDATSLYWADNINYHGRTDFLSYDSRANDYAPLVKKTKSLTKKKKSDTAKVLAIHKYIAKNFNYDYDKYERDTTAEMTFWENITHDQKSSITWQTKKGVCIDFATMECAMLRTAGIPSYPVGDDKHAWVKLKVNGRWTYIDPTDAVCDHHTSKQDLYQDYMTDYNPDYSL